MHFFLNNLYLCMVPIAFGYLYCIIPDNVTLWETGSHFWETRKHFRETRSYFLESGSKFSGDQRWPFSSYHFPLPFSSCFVLLYLFTVHFTVLHWKLSSPMYWTSLIGIWSRPAWPNRCLWPRTFSLTPTLSSSQLLGKLKSRLNLLVFFKDAKYLCNRDLFLLPSSVRISILD